MNEFIVDKNGLLCAQFIRNPFYSKDRINFLTDNNLEMQVGSMQHPKGHIIESHLHFLNKRKIENTSEVLIIVEGSLKAKIYDQDKNFIKDIVMKKGDILILVRGGHGFEVLEDIKMIEVKQGPFNGSIDKVRFK